MDTPSASASTHRFPARRAWCEIDLEAVQSNLVTARRASGGAAVMAVLKADGYGLGAAEIARVLEDRVACFGVACPAEALALRSAGIRAPLVLLGPVLPEDRAEVVRAGFTPSISGIDEAEDFARAARALGIRQPVHVVIDTGMGRIGVPEDEALATVAAIASLPDLAVEGVASHFPSADEDEPFTRAQAARFRDLVAGLGAAGVSPRWIHLANSAAILGYPEAALPLPLVRPGLMLYGIAPRSSRQWDLAPVLALKSRIALVRLLPAGHGVSYGRTWIAGRPTRVATIAIGYADGYPRQLSNQGAEVLIGGARCPLLGRVTMDQIMADVSDLAVPPVPGDEVVLIGSQGAETITVDEVAQRADTIAWEILTRLTPRVDRVYRATRGR